MTRASRGPRTKAKATSKGDLEKAAQVTGKELQRVTMAMLADLQRHFADIPEQEDRGLDGAPLTRNKIGQPTTVTLHVLNKLEFAFKVGATDREAAGFAGLPYDTLTAFFERHADYRQLTRSWKQERFVRAKAVITAAAAKDPFWAKYLLESAQPRKPGKLTPGATTNPGDFDFVIGVRKAAAKYELPEPGDQPPEGQAIDVEADVAE